MRIRGGKVRGGRQGHMVAFDKVRVKRKEFIPDLRGDHRRKAGH